MKTNFKEQKHLVITTETGYVVAIVTAKAGNHNISHLLATAICEFSVADKVEIQDEHPFIDSIETAPITFVANIYCDEVPGTYYTDTFFLTVTPVYNESN